MTAEEIPPRPVQLRNAPPAGDAVHYAGAGETLPLAAETAGDVDGADSRGQVLPFATAHAHAVDQMEPIGLGAQVDPGDSFSVSRPLPRSMDRRALFVAPALSRTETGCSGSRSERVSTQVNAR